MLWVEAFDPHEPWDPPKRYADAYCPDDGGIDFIMPRLGPDPSPRDIERTKALYSGEVTFLDRWIGHLIEKMEEHDLLKDTLILVLSDHGTQLWDHGDFGKGGSNLRRYNTGIVWQMRFPDAKPRTIPALVQSHDVMPTLLDLLDVPYARTQGQSVMPLVRGKADSLRESAVIGWAQFAEGNARAHASVRTHDWNYVRPVHTDDAPYLLYNLADDPLENDNVIDKHPHVAASLERDLEGVVGQPLPARLNEVCDKEPGPVQKYLAARKRFGN